MEVDMRACPGVLVVLALLAGVVGCKQVELGGAVTNADVAIDLLNQPGASYQLKHSTSESEAIETLGLGPWLNFNMVQQSLWLGNFEVEDALVDPVRLYLVTASGGGDIDANHDGVMDRVKIEVLGTWHAIMPGSLLLSCIFRATALSEAAYQHVEDRIGYISDEELMEQLDQFAVRVVTDVNADGQVDYTDVLAWSRLFYANSVRVDISFIDQLADAIRTGAAEYIVEAAAQSVLLNRTVPPVPPVPPVATGLSGRIVGDVVLTRADSPYVLTSRLTIEGNLRIESDVVIRGQGGPIDVVYGNIEIEGLPRQRVILDAVSINVYSALSEAISTVRNVDFVGGRLNFQIQKLLIEDSTLDGVNLTVSNTIASPDSLATIQRNVIEASTIYLQNSSPIRPDFTIRFVSNYISPLRTRMSTVVSRWLAPVSNLVMQDNTFNTNAIFLRSLDTAKMDISYNYWGPGGFPLDDIDTVIPDNTGPGGRPIIPYEPILLVAAADTPVHR
jgi:hypothetical protein